MASRVFPDELQELRPGEKLDFQFDFVDELNGDTAGSGTREVFDADGVDVTSTIAPMVGVVSGTTLTVTLTIPATGFSDSYLVIYTLEATTSTELFKKFLGLLVTEPAGVF